MHTSHIEFFAGRRWDVGGRRGGRRLGHAALAASSAGVQPSWRGCPAAECGAVRGAEGQLALRAGGRAHAGYFPLRA